MSAEHPRKRAARDLTGRKLSPEAVPIIFKGDKVGWSNAGATGPLKFGLPDGPRQPVQCDQKLATGRRCRRTVVTIYAPGRGQILWATHDGGWGSFRDIADVPESADFVCECGATRDVPVKEIAGTLLR